LVKVVLRTYGSIFDYETKVNLNLIIQKANLTEKQVIEYLQRLEKDEIISLQMANTDSEITFLKPREDDITINPIAKIIELQHQLKHEQIEAVLNYIQNDSVCRSQQLLSYFGEKSTIKCGICSVCISKNSNVIGSNNGNIPSLILEALMTEDLTSRQLVKQLRCSEKDVLKHLSELIEIKKIKITPANTYTSL
jgi:ATP-dependent DNA helicase RecQ